MRKFYYLFLLSMLPTFFYGQELSDADILSRINTFRPTHGAPIPKDIKSRLGATHVGGKYHLTDKPFIIEGSQKIHELGYGILKLWFDVERNEAKGYPYNSNWKLIEGTTPRQLAEHPYYKACFGMPFTTIALSHNDRFPGNSTKDLTGSFAIVEQNMYELTKYLLETYKDRELTFIIQNWEGDWLLRGGTGAEAQWHINGLADDYQVRIKNMCRWLTARQNGVNRARKEVRKTRCKVYHAVEANRVMDGMKGVPSVASHVLPGIEVDLVSWSAYDGISNDGLKMYKGIDFLRKNLHVTSEMKGEKMVMIGEVGYPENIKKRTKEEVMKMWDTCMAVYLAQGISHIFVWELYCNELKEDEFDKGAYPIRKAEELRGFWLIRPDGSKGWGQEYLDTLLARAGMKYE